MVSELDIWRSANLLIQQHGDQADLKAIQRAEAMLGKGNLDGHRVWLRILKKINELQRAAPEKGERRH